MTNHEWGICSAEVYETGKQHLLTPDQLCVDAVYALMTAHADKLHHQIPVCMKDIEPLSPEEIRNINNSGNYLQFLQRGSVRINFYPDIPEYLTTTLDLSLPETGLVRPRGSKVLEMYLKRATEGVDSELEALIKAASPSRELVAPVALPAIVS
jgi:hypothetical protein